VEFARLVSETNFWIFFFLTCVFGAGAAFLVGRAQAQKWRPIGATLFYMLLLGVAVRFCHYALFNETLVSPYYFAVDTLVLVACALIGYRMRRAEQMTTQYSWIYERTGLLSWRQKPGVG
jgi:hypothetical protein